MLRGGGHIGFHIFQRVIQQDADFVGERVTAGQVKGYLMENFLGRGPPVAPAFQEGTAFRIRQEKGKPVGAVHIQEGTPVEAIEAQDFQLDAFGLQGLPDGLHLGEGVIAAGEPEAEQIGCFQPCQGGRTLPDQLGFESDCHGGCLLLS